MIIDVRSVQFDSQNPLDLSSRRTTLLLALELIIDFLALELIIDFLALELIIDFLALELIIDFLALELIS
jgi:hypothetical protein